VFSLKVFVHMNEPKKPENRKIWSKFWLGLDWRVSGVLTLFVVTIDAMRDAAVTTSVGTIVVTKDHAAVALIAQTTEIDAAAMNAGMTVVEIAAETVAETAAQEARSSSAGVATRLQRKSSESETPHLKGKRSQVSFVIWANLRRNRQI
jgi:hypothetical protein